MILTDKNEIKQWLNCYGVKGYIINHDATVDVVGEVRLHNMELDELGVQFGKIYGDFHCNRNKLTSLKGAPYFIEGDAFFNDNKLTSLEYAPSHVGKTFFCQRNQLESLNHCPSFIGEDLVCGSNNFEAIDFFPSNLMGLFYHSAKDGKEKLKHFEEHYKGGDVLTIPSNVVKNIIQFHHLQATLMTNLQIEKKAKL